MNREEEHRETGKVPAYKIPQENLILTFKGIKEHIEKSGFKVIIERYGDKSILLGRINLDAPHEDTNQSYISTAYSIEAVPMSVKKMPRIIQSYMEVQVVRKLYTELNRLGLIKSLSLKTKYEIQEED